MTKLTVNGLSHQTPSGKVLLQDVSFSLPSGAVLAIAGPNGAGKSTLLNLLSGLSPLTQGDVLIGDQSLRNISPNARAQKIAVVSQQSLPDNRLSVRDYVALGQMPIWAQRSTAAHVQDLEEVLARARLLPLAQSSLGELSGGERQRAHIARALAQSPSLLFLDEPTNHLDPDAKGRMLSLMAGLGITVVMVLHDLVMIPEFATHVLLLQHARLQAFGLVPEVLQPRTVYDIFGVDYLLLPHGDRQIPALDIRRTNSNP